MDLDCMAFFIRYDGMIVPMYICVLFIYLQESDVWQILDSSLSW